MAQDETRREGYEEGASGGPKTASSPPDTPSSPPVPDLAAIESERDEYLELAKRTKADFENFRKRVARQEAEAEMRARGEFARSLVPVVDNLERALASANAEEDHLAQGVRLVYEELAAVLHR